MWPHSHFPSETLWLPFGYIKTQKLDMRVSELWVSLHCGVGPGQPSHSPLPLRLALEPPTPHLEVCQRAGLGHLQPACCQQRPLAQCPLLASIPHALLDPPSPKFLEVLQFALYWSEGAPSCNTSPYSLLDTPLWQSRLERSQAAT